MHGLPLSSYQYPLHCVHPRALTAWTISGFSEKLSPFRRYIDACGKWPTNRKEFIDECGRLPVQALSGLTFEDLAKIYCSRHCMMHRTVEELFESSVEHELIRKLRNSMWHWGCGGRNSSDWNTLVRAREGIRRFSFGLPGFVARLDHSKWYHPQGYAKYSDVFLDGVFGFLIYQGDRHVMTIGFSVASHDRILVSQIQLANHKGNRFLYRLPEPLVDHVLRRLREAFVGLNIFLVCGGSLSDYHIAQLRSSLRETRERIREDCRRIRRYKTGDEDLTRHLRQYRETKEHILVCRRDAQRIRRMYSTLSAHRLAVDQPLCLRRLTFYPVESNVL